MSGLRRNSSACGPRQQGYDPYMLGRSKGYGGQHTGRQPSNNSRRTLASNYGQGYPAPGKTASLNDASVNIRDCMHWPASVSHLKNQQYQMQQQQQNSYGSRSYSNMCYQNAGDGGAPPKIYMSVPGGKAGNSQLPMQNIPCQIVPPGTDPMSVIKPLAPVTVRVQAPPDFMAGNPGQPKTFSLSPAQLYGAAVNQQR